MLKTLKKVKKSSMKLEKKLETQKSFDTLKLSRNFDVLMLQRFNHQKFGFHEQPCS